MDSGFECAEGLRCEIPPGETVGMCEAVKCTATQNSCPVESPVCSSGVCRGCSGNTECASLSADAPLCSGGRCVGCTGNSDCTSDAAKAVCDATTKTCRACQLHSDCVTSGVCAKDDTFANLAAPIVKGSCVPDGRINTVPSGSSASALTLALMNTSTAKPYIRIANNVNITNTKISLGSLPAGLPSLYIIGPLGDTSPSMFTTVPSSIGNATGTAMEVSAGVHTILEGLVFNQSNIDLQCTSGSTQTKVKVLRSAFTASGKAIVSTGNACELTIDSSWIGSIPILGLSSNTQAMDLDSTKLDIVNSVFFKNGNPPTTFGGIRLTNGGGLNPSPAVHIVNSSFVENVFPDGGDKALAINCKYATMGQMSIVNTLFLNSGVVGGGNTYVHANCRPTSPVSVFGTASNEAGFPGTTLADGLDILVNGAGGDLHYSDTATSDVTSGGVASPPSSVAIPTVDMDGKTRPATQISIGAFQK